MKEIPDKRTILFEPDLGSFRVLSLRGKKLEKIYQTGREYAYEKLKEI
jgi:hypothetical protein